MSGEGLSGGKIVEDNKSREKNRLWVRRRKMTGGRVCNKRKASGWRGIARW